MGTLRITIPGIHPSAAAIEEIVNRHGNRMYQLAYRLTGSTADAEDVVQTVFLKLYQSWVVVSKGVNLGAWLHRVTANAAMDVHRRRRRTKGLDDEEGGGLDGLPADGPPPETGSETRELGEALEKGLARLTPNQRAAIILFDHEGLKGKEIARILEVSDAAVRSYIHAGRQKLKAWLRPYAGDA